MDHKHLIMILILCSCSFVISVSVSNLTTKEKLGLVQNLDEENSENGYLPFNETSVDTLASMNNSNNSESLEKDSMNTLNISEVTDGNTSTEASIQINNNVDYNKSTRSTTSGLLTSQKSASYIKRTADPIKTISAFNMTTSSTILNPSMHVTKVYSKSRGTGTPIKHDERKATTERIYNAIYINFYHEFISVQKPSKDVFRNYSLAAKRSTRMPTIITKLSTLSHRSENPKIILKSKINDFKTENKDPSLTETVIKKPPKTHQKSFDNKIKNQIKEITTQSSSSTIKMTTIRAPWKTRLRNDDESSFDKVCNLEKDEGSGPERYSMWYFNKETGKCEWFTYLGNGGNGNRFYYRANCESSCIERITNLCGRSDIVNCMESWLQCKMEPDSECQEIALMDRLDAQLECPPMQPICINLPREIRNSPVYLTHQSLIPSDCKLPKDQGFCKTDSDSSLVYYYSEKLNDCLGFLYSKCGGNLNRFPSKTDCMNRCAI